MKSTSLLLFASLFTELYIVKAFKLTILHTNDIHGRFVETNVFGGLCLTKDHKDGTCYGGVSKRATVVKQIRAKETNVLLLDAGDEFTGSLWYNIYKGNATWKVMNELKYDAMALGNHDFDDGPANTARFLRHVNFSVIMSNVDASKEPTWSGQPLYVKSKVFEIGGEKVGVVGYVLETTPKYSRPGPGPNIKFLPIIDSLKKATAELRQQGINKIIALGHSGIEMDKKIAKEVIGVDVVVGGHSNTFLYSGTPVKGLKPFGPYPLVVQSNDGVNVPVVQDYAYGVYQGRLDLEFDKEGKVTKWDGQPILLDNSVAKDAEMERLVTSLRAPVDKAAKEKLGRSLVHLNGDSTDCRLKECNLGNLITDSMVYYHANQTATSQYWTEASIAVVIASSFRQFIDVNPDDYITYDYTIDTLLYLNMIDMIQLKGIDLKGLLEHAVSNYNVKKPAWRFLQVSGLKVVYNTHKPAGQRVVSVQTLCSQCRVPVYETLKNTATYNVLINSYMGIGGEGYSIIPEKALSYRQGTVKDNDVLAEYIRTHNPVFIGVEGRILFVGDKMASSGGDILVVKALLVVMLHLAFQIL